MAGIPGGLTAIEFARLRLDAWKALESWGTTKPAPIENAPDFKTHVPWDWGERMRRADELTLWLLSQPPAAPSESDP